ncbi:hypothetical protein [Bradyrhizobium sp. SZCCHNS3051]|uniref:hypothetical protein n=1 Tax=Bradyrhizobium sp. SZCCHNS3051 TaxID=3057320 RepID=UPI0029160525|nr:hypothetical protein [Bradyrhizobium sp. SZCCHNS3051]
MPRSDRHTPTCPDGRPLKITFGEMREIGVHGVLVYCHRGHHVALCADHWPPDEMRLSDLEATLRVSGLRSPWRRRAA